MKTKKWIISLVVAVTILAVVIAFDLVSKYLAETKLETLGNSANFIPGFINFVLVHNNGGGFNIFAGNIVFLVIFSVLIILVLTLFFARRLTKCKNDASITLGFAYGFVFGGFFGNLFDRLAFGYVRDFINFQFFKFPVFNIADISLCIGAVLLVVYFIFLFDKEGKPKKKKGEEK